MDVTAKAIRAGGWWAVEVPEVPGAFTQVKRLDQVDTMVSDAVALMTDVDPSDVNVTLDVALPDELRSHLLALIDLNERAKALSAEASASSRVVVKSLRSHNLSVRDVGALLKISPQRVSQLAATTRDAGG